MLHAVFGTSRFDWHGYKQRVACHIINLNYCHTIVNLFSREIHLDDSHAKSAQNEAIFACIPWRLSHTFSSQISPGSEKHVNKIQIWATISKQSALYSYTPNIVNGITIKEPAISMKCGKESIT